jgi:hypothetical protein
MKKLALLVAGAVLVACGGDVKFPKTEDVYKAAYEAVEALEAHPGVSEYVEKAKQAVAIAQSVCDQLPEGGAADPVCAEVDKLADALKE